MRNHVIAVDIGTKSVRAGIFNSSGDLLVKTEKPITLIRSGEGHAEYSSEDIWAAVCQAVKLGLAQSALEPSCIGGIGFDATCSLVVRDQAGQPINISHTGGDPQIDTIAWLDHRAIAEARICTDTGHEILNYSGQVMSPEMQIPKLMWIKRHLPKVWDNIGYVFDLADFMTWKSTGSPARSRCTLTSKWNYLTHREHGWQTDFLAQIDLEDLQQRGHLPETTVPVGENIGLLSPEAAHALGLTTDCCVASGMIDAYAGALGVLGRAQEGALALIAGTSSCMVGLSSQPQQAGMGIWGPYYEALFPETWLVETGQSATGALLDHIVRMHAAGGEPTTSLHSKINQRISQLRQTRDALGSHIFVLPDFHGNRFPYADPYAVGVISGLTLDTSFDGLCALYWRTAIAIALGVRHNLETLKSFGYRADELHITGGHLKSPLMIELYRQVTGCTIVVPKIKEAVLLGTAIAATAACGLHPDLAGAVKAMTSEADVHEPDITSQALYDLDYRRFLAMYRHRAELNAMT